MIVATVDLSEPRVDALLDRDRGRDPRQPVERGPGQLLDELARVGRHGLHEPALALGEDDVEGERRLARARDPRDDGQLAQGQGDRQVLQVVLARADDLDRPGRAWRLQAGTRGRLRHHRLLLRGIPLGKRRPQEGRRGDPGLRHLLGCSLGHDPPARLPGLRPHLDDPVGRLEHVEVVLDDDEAVAALHEGLQHAEEPRDVVAVEPRRRLVQQEQGSRLAGQGAEVADELQPLGFAAAQRVERLAEREVAEADGVEGGQAVADLRVALEETERVGHAHREDVGDRGPVPLDREDLRLEPAPLADGAGDEDVGEELHLDPLVAEALAVVAPAVPAVEREARRPHPRLLRPRGAREELADQVPRLDVEGGIRARGPRDRPLVDEDGLGDALRPADCREGRRVLAGAPPERQESLVDDVVEERRLAGAGDAAQADEAPEGDPHVEGPDVVLCDALELEGRLPARRRAGALREAVSAAAPRNTRR